MDILDIIKSESCTPKLKAKTKNECLRELAELLSEGMKGVTIEDIHSCLKEREEIGSTGFEDGIAIPHGKIKGIDDFAMCIAISKKGIDFKSIDGKKTHIFFTVVGPDEKMKEHLQILAQISRISRNPKARKELLNSPTPFVLKEMFTRFVSDAAMNGTPQGKDKLIIIILNDEKFLEDIIDIFLERDIRGANIIDSSGIKDQLSNIPLFSNFFNFLGERSDSAKTLMTVVKESEVAGIASEIEEVMGDLDSHTGGMVLALDLFFLKGSLEF